MKTTLLFLFVTLVVANGLRAQHCRFDGSYMIVVYLADEKGKPLLSPSGLVLKEKTNPKADSCSFAPGLLAIPFKKAEESLQGKYDGSWQDWSRGRSEKADFMKNGYYIVLLNMSQNTCMIKQGSGYQYRPRSFTIELDGIMVDVPKESIYPLCTDAGSWNRIRAIAIIKK